MIHISITDRDGKVLLPQELATVAELREVADWARSLVRECERLAKLKQEAAPAAKGGVPYLS
jgi:hypothetical protein